MNSRKVRRGRGAGLGPGRRPRKPRGGSGGKSGVCSFAIPAAAYHLLAAFARLALVRSQIGRAS
jgi:hypothetical protein